MIINNISLTKKGNLLKVSADFRMEKERKDQHIYFELHASHAPQVEFDATPFVAALLIPAMSANESITVKNNVISKQFLKNTQQLMKVLNSWDKQFHIIDINADTKTDRKRRSGRAMFFSGGVDSFYTYIKKKKESKKIKYFLLVHGFDIELENEPFFQSVMRGISKLSQEERVELLTLKTNAKKIIEKYIEWDWGHGGALAASALLIRKSFNEVYIAGALRKDQLFPYGTHPAIDKFWGTESVSFHHDGNEYDRLGKVMSVVGKSKIALSHLRVCNQNLKGKYNCSKCFKCLWTMMTLECAGILQNAKTFESEINLESVKKMRYTFERNYHLAGIRIINELKRQKRRNDLQKAIQISLSRSKNPTFILRFAAAVAELDKKYNKRRLYLAIFSANRNQDRNTAFKILAKQGIIK